MKILSMKATFGKLEGQTLTFTPGLNVIHAPNEWGKSTWCAFIVAMLYGIDTRERNTATALADKTRYTPWSGAPMSGQMDIEWNGRRITLERQSTPRIPFGEFRAYETESGLPVAELTAANCGQQLLGVEKSVFTRSAFIRLSDMPVVQDEALRRRLNALVTTGDESGTADTLAQKLRDLKNKCRHNRTGLLPQAEAQRDDLQRKLEQLQQLQEQIGQLQQRQTALKQQVELLNNHRQALAYNAACQDAAKTAAAQAGYDAAKDAYDALAARCAQLPSNEEAQEQVLHLEQLRMDYEELQQTQLPPAPASPQTPDIFAGMSAAQAMQQAKSDTDAYRMLCKPISILPLIIGLACVIAAVIVALIDWKLALTFPVFAAIFIGAYLRNKRLQKRDRDNVAARYKELPVEQWIPAAAAYEAAEQDHAQRQSAHRALCQQLEFRKEQLMEQISCQTGGESLNQCIDGWRQTMEVHAQLANAYHTLELAKQHMQTLQAMAKTSAPPAFDDTLTYSAAETERLLADAMAQQHQLQLRAGQLIGQQEALGQPQALAQQLQQVNHRIDRLEQTYNALELAMNTLTAASQTLQRRFAPQLSQRACAIFSHLTGGRYDRLQLTQDLSIEAGAQDEVGLQSARYRSDGTVDQLYLALRLAVAEELMPDAPLVLDDALVRFDDTRLAAAMELLRQAGQEKQVLLFTCQSREQA